MAHRHSRPLVVAVAGGSGAGKSTVVQGVVGRMADLRVEVLAHDFYYRDRGDVPLEYRAKLNFDHPDAFETSLLIDHIRSLREGLSVDVPQYDYVSHTRMAETVRKGAGDVVIVEGILVLADDDLCEVADLRVFVDTSAETRLARRVQRDCLERGRSRESVVKQFRDSVQPMHELFVHPTKARAGLVLSGENDVGLCVAAFESELRALMPPARTQGQ